MHLIWFTLAIKQYYYTSFIYGDRRREEETSAPDRLYRLRVRMLMYLALKEDQLATIAEIAESYDISKTI